MFQVDVQHPVESHAQFVQLRELCSPRVLHRDEHAAQNEVERYARGCDERIGDGLPRRSVKAVGENCEVRGCTDGHSKIYGRVVKVAHERTAFRNARVDVEHHRYAEHECGRDDADGLQSLRGVVRSVAPRSRPRDAVSPKHERGEEVRPGIGALQMTDAKHRSSALSVWLAAAVAHDKVIGRVGVLHKVGRVAIHGIRPDAWCPSGAIVRRRACSRALSNAISTPASARVATPAVDQMHATDEAPGVAIVDGPMTDEEAAAAIWWQNMVSTPGGRSVIDHMAHVSDCGVHSNYESSCLEICDQIRAFLYLYEKSPTALGLPRVHPRFIAIVNFSGTRSVLYTNESHLIKLLLAQEVDNSAQQSQRCENVVRGVKSMLAFQEHHPEMSLLLVYSLPFATILEDVHWDLRTLRRRPNGTVEHGHLCYNLMYGTLGRAPWPAKATRANEAHMECVVKSMADAMSRSYRAQDLDVGNGDESGGNCHAHTIGGSARKFETDERLRNLCNTLLKNQKEQDAQHSADTESLKKKHAEELKAMRDDQRVAYEIERGREIKLTADLEKKTAEVIESKKLVEEARVELRGKEFEWEHRAQELHKRISTWEERAHLADRRLFEETERHERESAANDAMQRSTVEAVERRLATTQVEAQAARNEHELTLSRLCVLSEKMEALDDLRETTVFAQEQEHFERLRRRVASGLLCVAALRHAETCAQLAELRAAKRQSPPAPVLTTTAEVGTATVSVSTRADFELGELSAQYARLQDEHAVATRENEALKRDLAVFADLKTCKHGGVAASSVDAMAANINANLSKLVAVARGRDCEREHYQCAAPQNSVHLAPYYPEAAYGCDFFATAYSPNAAPFFGAAPPHMQMCGGAYCAAPFLATVPPSPPAPSAPSAPVGVRGAQKTRRHQGHPL